MIVWFNLVPYLANDAIFIDQESLAVHAHELLAVHVPLFIDTVKLRDADVGISKQGEGQTIVPKRLAFS